MELLDLNKHTIEEIPGKILVVNGAEYILMEMFAEGGEKFCFPLKNIKSKQVLLLAKLEKTKPGTEAYDKIIKRVDARFPFVVSLPLSKKEAEAYTLASKDGIILHTETYEISGGLFDIQEMLSAVDNPDAHNVLFDAANKLLKDDNIDAAIAKYQEILSLNPNNNYALSNLSVCLLRTGNTSEAIGMALNACSIEPNLISGYLNLAIMFLQLDDGKAASDILQKSLDRWQWHFKTLNFQMRIAYDYNFTDILEKGIEILRPYAKEDVLGYYSDLLKKSKVNKEEFLQLTAIASNYQLNKEWAKAEKVYCEALPKSKDNYLAKINYCICLFHQGKYDVLKQPALSAYYAAKNFIQRMISIILLILSGQANEDIDISKNLLIYLADTIDNEFDLPGIPMASLNQNGENVIIEQTDVTPILDCIKFFMNNESESPTKQKLDSLLQLYRKYGDALNKNK